MIHASFKWHGDEVAAGFRKATFEGIRRAVVFLWTKLQEVLNTPAAAKRRKFKRPRTDGRKTHLVYTPSKPGDPPAKRTGFLQRNVGYELDEANLTGRVGVARNAIYGAFLELGTQHMEARPWLVSTLEAHMDELRQIVRPEMEEGGR